MKQRSYFVRYGNTIVFFVWDKHFQQYFKGTSVCQPEDEFNLDLGISIARTKAVIKMRAFYARLAEDKLEYIKMLKKEEKELKKQREYWLNKTEESYNKLNNILTNLEK